MEIKTASPGATGPAAADSTEKDIKDASPVDKVAADDAAATSAPPPPPPPQQTSQLGPRPAVFKSVGHEVLFVFMATAAMMANSFFVGAVTTVTAIIGRELNMTQGEITWIAASTQLTAGAFQLALGQLSDLLGRRLMFILGFGSFAIFSVITGFAQNPLWMDVLCGFVGISSAMMVPPAIAILGAAYDRPSKRKNLAFSAFSAGNPIGFALGSILGGVAAGLFGWRAIFWLIAIIWGFLAVVAIWAVPSVEAFEDDGASTTDSGGGGAALADKKKKPKGARRAAFKDFAAKFDTVGAVLTLIGTGMFTAAITLAPSDGWKAPQVLVLLLVGLALIVAFLYWETYWPYPLMPPKIWKDRNFSLLIASLVLGFMAFNSAVFWLSLFMQEVQHMGALEVGVRLLPQTVAGLVWNVVAGSILHLVNNTLLHGIGAIAFIVANLLLSFVRPESNYWALIFPALIIQVLGADFQFNVVNMYVMQSLPPHQQGLAGGVFNTMTRLFATLGLGITTAVYGAVAQTEQGMADPMLPYTRTFQVSIAFAGAGVLCLPFIRVGTQGNEPPRMDDEEASPPQEQKQEVGDVKRKE